jgi:DNA invertase Pin-like site-specific DNA recombinase
MIAAYTRVSTDEQDITLQKAAITQWLERSAIDLSSVKWYEDDGRSGKNTARPAFTSLLADIDKQKVNTVVCYKLDRLSRSMLDGMTVIGRWAAQGIRIVSITQQIDMSGIVGQMIASILFGFAQMERELILERQKLGIAKAKAAGKYKGRKPGSFKGDADKARELRAKGVKLVDIAAALGVCPRSVNRYLGTEPIPQDRTLVADPKRQRRVELMMELESLREETREESSLA